MLYKTNDITIYTYIAIASAMWDKTKMDLCTYLAGAFGRDVTIWVDAILRIAFECTAIYCCIAICR